MGQTSTNPGNRVRAQREARELSQVALAEAAGLTRQSIGAIEAGRATPAVDVALRIARALDAQVEELFGVEPPAVRINVEPVGAEPGDLEPGGRVALAQVGGRWVSHPLDGGSIGLSADGLVTRARRQRAEVELLRTAAEAADNVVLMGCAPALGILADRLNGRRGAGRFLWLARSSTRALEALARRQIHLAGVHLVDEATGEANVPDVRRHTRRRAVVLITLARWEAGLVLGRRNPKRIRTAAQLGQSGLRLVIREPGSGARRLLERELLRAGLPLRLLRTAAVQATGHLEVAQSVAHGASDVGVATRDAARAFDLDFIPLAEERYDLAIPREGLTDPRLERLLDLLTTSAFRRDLESLGYDPRPCGERVAELHAA